MLVFDFLHLVGGRLGRYGLLPMQTMRSNQIPALHTGRQGQPRGVRRRVMTTFLLFWLSSALLGVSMPALYAAPQPSGLASSFMATTAINVAQGKPATQSSTYPNPVGCFTADKAVDGNTSGVNTDCRMSHTDFNAQAWWQVDLQAQYQISSIDLWNRTDCCADRLTNFDVLVSQDGQNWSKFYYAGTAPRTTNFPVNAVVRYVKVQLRGTNYLQLAEVQVWGTPVLLQVSGNNQVIAPNDTTPSPADNTDLGAVVPNGTQSKAFVLRNTGQNNVTVSALTLSDNSFTLVNPPSLPLTLAPNSTQAITVQFQQAALGLRTATLTIASNDPTTPSYAFTLQASAADAAAALDFDGVNDYAELPNSAALNQYVTTGELTVEYWIKPQVNSGKSTIVSKRTAANNGGFVFESDAGTLAFTHWIHTSAGWKAVQFTYTPNVWQHIAFVVKAGDAIRVYQNGVLKGTTSLAGVPNFTPTTAALRLMYDGNFEPRIGKGQLDELHIWSRALSPSEIQARLNCELAANLNGLVARYNFNQGFALTGNSTITTLTDGSGGNNNATLFNFALSGSSSNWVAPGAVTSGQSCLPVLNVQGNGATIAAGDTTPATDDFTDFQNATVRSGLAVRTFTLANTGASDLTGVNVTLTGAGAGDFAVTLPPASSVAAGSSTTFQIRFNPSALGARPATVNIASNDSARNPYTFAVTGAGVAATPGPVVAWGSNGSGESNVPSGLGNIIALESGQTHSVGLKDDGTVAVWGSNVYGQLNVPAGLNNVIAIASRHNHTLALKSDGTVVAWGFNWIGQTDVPANLTNVKALAAGISHSLALKSDGTVVGWGYNTFGQSTVPSGLNNVIAIAAGNEHSVALKNDGTVVAWGNSAYTAVPAGLKGVVAIAANSFHSLALKGDGTVVAWGRNDFGQTAVPLGLSNVVAIAAGVNHSVALKADGTVVVWGSNSDGQGIVPSGLTGVTGIAASANHNLALLAADTTAPDTSLTSQPANPSNSSNASFSFTGVDNMTPANGLTFQCQLDSAAFAPCTSPQSYTGLSGGKHTFAVKAVDAAGNSDGSAASYLWSLIPPAPVINVTGNNRAITSGDDTPATVDYTNFLSATVNTGNLVQTFVIANTGNADLTGLSVSVTGGEAGDFTVSQAPASSVASGSSTTFQIRFAPSALGTRTTTVSIASNDTTQNPYTFAITGIGVPIPRPALWAPGTPIRVVDGRFSVPVNFTANGTTISALGFALDYDESCLLFNAADTDGDGVPDSITGLPSAFAPSIQHYPDHIGGELEIALFDDTQPIATFTTGPLFTIEFMVNPACITTDGSSRLVTVGFGKTPAASFSDPASHDVPGDATGATIPLTFNAAPTALTLSNDNLDENAPAGSTVGTFSTTDPNVGDTHTYSLVAGEGAADNGSFTLAGNVLKTTEVFNHEPKPEYTLRVRTTDSEGMYFERAFIIKANDVYEAPTGVSTIDGPLSDGDNATTDVQENAAAGTLVATLSPANPDTNNAYSYAFVSGAGDTDNASFLIDGNALKSAAVFDYEKKNSYSIRVQITDRLGQTADQVIVVHIDNVVEAPQAVDDLVDPRVTVFLGGQVGAIDVLANDAHEAGTTLQVASVTQPAAGQGSVTNNTSNVLYTAPQANGSTSFTYQATSGAAPSNSATVSLSYVANDQRGDCNGNGNVAAADFIATVLEIFDTHNTTGPDGYPAWWLTYTGDYAGSPRGCDSNGSGNPKGVNGHPQASITAADIVCSVLIFFGHPCGAGVQAASAQAANLSVDATPATNGAETTVTVALQTGGNNVAAAAFALDWGNAPFDATDADGDGVPDAVTLTLPAGVSKSVNWNATEQRLEVALYGTALPLPTLSDGVLVTVRTAGNVTPTLTLASLSDAEGSDLLAAPRTGVFLPLVAR